MRYLVITCLLLSGCAPEISAPELGRIDERPNGDVIRLGGSILVTPIVRRLARLFIEQSPGKRIVVEAALDPEGARNAHTDGLLDGALVVDPVTSATLRTTNVARSELVLALGPGITTRAFDADALRTLLVGKPTVGITEGTYFPPRERELLQALRRRSTHLGSIFLDPNSRKSTTSLTYGRPLWEQVAAVRRGITLADRGNLRLFGAPVWVGTLTDIKQPFISFAIVTKKNPTARLAEFLEYVLSDAGETALAEMGFQREGGSP